MPKAERASFNIPVSEDVVRLAEMAGRPKDEAFRLGAIDAILLRIEERVRINGISVNPK